MNAANIKIIPVVTDESAACFIEGHRRKEKRADGVELTTAPLKVGQPCDILALACHGYEGHGIGERFTVRQDITLDNVYIAKCDESGRVNVTKLSCRGHRDTTFRMSGHASFAHYSLEYTTPDGLRLLGKLNTEFCTLSFESPDREYPKIIGVDIHGYVYDPAAAIQGLVA